MNRLKTAMLLATLTFLFLFIGQLLGGRSGLVIALGFAIVMNFAAYWWSDKMVLRMYHAQEVSETQSPELFAIVRNLCVRSNLPMPKVYLIPEEAPNAFATGRNPQHAAVAVTAGLLRLLQKDEVEAVIAHELGHVSNRDTLVMTVAATLAGALSMLAHWAAWGAMFGRSDDDDDGGGLIGLLLGVFIAPIAAGLIQMAISRSREFLADERGAKLCGNPLALASALRRIDGWSRRVKMSSGSPATAHLFIINPFTADGISRMFSTHPPTEARIERLTAMAGARVGTAVF